MVLGLAGATTVGTVSVAFQFTSADRLADILRPVGQGRRNVLLGTATVEDWSLQEGSRFTLDTGHVLELVDVQAFPVDRGRPAGLRPRAFVARFDVKEGAPLSDSRLYRFNHAEGGMFDLLLAHGAPDMPLRMLAVLA
jgi:hypothetical protein